MATEAARLVTPGSAEELAAEMRSASAAGRALRVRGAGTKLGWATAAAGTPEVELSTAGLDRILEHNAGDLTAVLEAGVPLAAAQERFATEGQMLALDPPDGGATVGGVVAAGDSGPLRSRYGGVRDLVVGVTVALSDGTVAKAGGKVIKNVAGYDLAKLFAGSLGSLGAILQVSVRLHPIPPATVSAAGGTADPGVLASAAAALTHAPLEHTGLDIRWEAGEGWALARFGGAACGPQAEAAAEIMREAGLRVELVEDDDRLWAAQRELQRARAGEPDTVLRVSALQTDLPALLAEAERHSAELVSRAPLGLSWLRVRDPADAPQVAEALRRRFTAVLLDAPAEVRGRVDPWGARDEAGLELMRRVKERFDPAGACAPGVLL
jgi:glycolate oxidase FAD binding subunit